MRTPMETVTPKFSSDDQFKRRSYDQFFFFLGGGGGGGGGLNSIAET